MEEGYSLVILTRGTQFDALRGADLWNGHKSNENAVFSTFAQGCWGWGCTRLLFHELRQLKRRDEDKPVLQQVLQQLYAGRSSSLRLPEQIWLGRSVACGTA